MYSTRVTAMASARATIDAGARMGDVLDRLARLLRGVGSADTSQAAAGVAFLEAFAQRYRSDAPATVRHMDLPLARLSDAYGLTALDVDLILLAGLSQEHEGFASLLRAAHPRGEPACAVGLASQVLALDSGSRSDSDMVLRQGVALRAGLVGLDGDGPFPERSLALAPELWPALQGADAWPGGGERVGIAVCADGLSAWLASDDVRRAMEAVRRRASVTVLVEGVTAEQALHRGALIAEAAKAEYVRVRWPAAPPAAYAGWVGAHVALRGWTPVLGLGAADGEHAVQVPELPLFTGTCIVCAPRGVARPRADGPILPVTAPAMRPAERLELWQRVAPDLRDDVPWMAARYGLEPDRVQQLLRDARLAAALERRNPVPADVAASARARCNGGLPGGLELRVPRARWDDLVLPEDRKQMLRDAVDRLLLQARVLDQWGFLENKAGARGTRVLLSGPPGTGKTLAAEVMAATLGVDLLVVDIARVVSKWIGETEKNLAQVFDAAESSAAVLLFDEADALFGKRTEVSDAHDRYANLETAYLLARLERFEGLTVLSTNLRQNIDPAFLRRLDFAIDFQEPSRRERETLWRKHIPPGAPLAEDVDFTELANLYALAGGHIRNAAVAAGYLAAAQGRPIGKRELARAVQREYDKSGRAFPGFPVGLGPDAR